MIDAYPFKDQILKGSGQSGSGANGGNGGGSDGKTMKRTEFERLDPAAKSKAMSDGTKLVD